MNVRSLFIPALLAMPLLAHAGDPVKFDVFLGGKLERKISLSGPNAAYKFSPAGHAETILELKLIAPEPLILEIKESMVERADSEVTGRITLITPGSSMASSDIKGVKFQHDYVLVRAE